MRANVAQAIKWTPGMATMRYNYRGFQRYFLSGQVHLAAGNKIIDGSIIDISMTGLGLLTSANSVLRDSSRRTWLCTLSSADLPQDIRCLVRLVRRTSSRFGMSIGCVIVDIDDENLALLKAYRALALARGNPRLS